MDVSVNFMHPYEGRVISVTLDNSLTGREVIAELIANNFVEAHDSGYSLAIKGGNQLDNSKTLLMNGVKDNHTIRVIPMTDAGGGFYSSTDSVPGFEKSPREKFDLENLIKSPQAFQMIVHLYQDTLKENRILYNKIEEKNTLLENERIKSNNRLISSFLLVVSQVVIGIGCSIIVSNKDLGVWILGAGVLQSLLAIFFNFYKNKPILKKGDD